MDVHKLRHKANFFNALKGLSKQDKLNYFQNCPNEAIETMCEACYNLLKHKKLKNAKKVQDKIKPIHSSVKKLSKRATDIKSKRSILNDSNIACGLTSAIGQSILPFLNSLLKKIENDTRKPKPKKKTVKNNKKKK